MNVSLWTWAATLVAVLAILAVDLLVIGRRPHEPSIRESTMWVVFYVALAIAFGLGVLTASGSRYAGEFFAGWLTEYSLSVDNLFVFVIIMARFAVKRVYQQRVLMVGIVLALVMRGLFIAAGAAVIDRFVWVFYLFGAFLIYTAVKLARQSDGDEQEEFHENPVIGWVRRVLPISRVYDGARALTTENGRRMFTPMFVVMVAIGTTDLIFAMDSIPAIFGLTREPYLVFTANVFALMGLRQLYFLLGGLLDRLLYLSAGLSVVLGFIGVKLVLEALHDNNMPFLNGGRPIAWAPQIPIWLSLLIIVGTLVIATVASVYRARQLGGDGPSPGGAARAGEPVPVPGHRRAGDQESGEPAGFAG
jgi:tellurite resistance protein TerC